MNRKALWAVCGVILLPLVSYLIVKYFSDEAVIMPRRYYFDTVKTTIKSRTAIADA